MEKYYSDLTKQTYYSEATKEAEEKAYKEAMAEKEKEEQVLKETREARVKEYNEALDKLVALRKDYMEKYAEKKKALDQELNDYNTKISQEYLDQKKEVLDVIDKFNKDYPNGIYISYRAGKPGNGVLPRVFDSWVFEDPFNFFENPFASITSKLLK